MKTTFLKTVLGILITLSSSFVSAQAWEVLGNIDFLQNSIRSSLTLDNDNIPYVFIKNSSNKGSVIKYTNDDWQFVGQPEFISNISLVLEDIVMTTDNNNIPYVAYVGDSSQNYPMTIMRFENDTWGVVSQFFSIGSLISLDFDSNNVLYLSYKSISHKINVIKFENNNWETVGAPDFTLGMAGYTSFTFDNNNIPYVFFRDGANDDKATVMKFENNNWQTVGEAGFSEGDALHFSIIFDSNNIPYVAYTDIESSNEIIVQRFVENNWEIIGAGFSENWVSDVTLAFDSNDIMYVLYKDQENDDRAKVQKFENGNWQFVGPGTGLSEGTNFLDLEIGTDGALYVSYVVLDGGGVTVKKFDPTAGVATSVFNQVEMYPNPANGVVYIDNLPNDTTVTITDMTGKLIYSMKQVGYTLSIDTAKFAKGLYQVQITNNGKSIAKKLVVK
jgi:hypothetical protein